MLMPILVALALVLATTPALANKRASADLNLQARPFAQQAEQIRADLVDNKAYAEISADNRSKVLDLLVRMESMLEASPSVDAMSNQSKADPLNAQEEINTILTGARADSRLICTREVTTGSHRKQQRCMTVAERNRQREQDKEDLTRFQQMRTTNPSFSEP